jgi:flagellar hook-basal body complex protein FliE
MNPLSAIQRYLPATLRPELQPGGPQGLTGARAIPAGELRDLSPLVPLNSVQGASAPPASFGSLMGRLVQEVASKQHAGQESLNGLLSGQNVSLHQAMIALEEASVSFQLMVEVRNKLLESYQELMRMQI